MIWFLLPLLYAPIFAEASNTPKWIFLSLVLPALIFRIRLERPSPAHWAGLFFLIWGALTILWGPLWEGLDRLWRYIIVAMAFYYGSSLTARQFRRAVIALALGVLVSLPIVVAQRWWGFTGVMEAVSPSGLFLNSNYLAEIATMGAAGVAFLVWPLLPLMLATMAVPLSKGAFVAVGLTTWWWLWGHSRRWAIAVMLLTILATGASYKLWIDNDSVQVRSQLFANSWAMVHDKPWGQGLGGFWAGYAEYHDAVLPTHGATYGWDARPRTAHNDALTLLVEAGYPGAGLAAFIVLFALTRRAVSREANIYLAERTHKAAHFILFAFLALGLFAFPSIVPATAFLAALSAGFLCRGGSDVRNGGDIWRGAIR